MKRTDSFNFVKIVVDKLPTRCNYCGNFFWRDNGFWCAFNGIGVTPMDLRPVGCPLEVERNCGNCKSYFDGSKDDPSFCFKTSNSVVKTDYCSRWESNYGF